jgi:hypothetical protein
LAIKQSILVKLIAVIFPSLWGPIFSLSLSLSDVDACPGRGGAFTKLLPSVLYDDFWQGEEAQWSFLEKHCRGQ